MKRKDDIDARLGDLLKKELPEAPADGWFVRKVMNRLPDKPRGRTKSLPEILCYIASCIGLVCAWIYSVHTTVTEGLTLYSVSLSGILTMLTLFCIGVFAFPVLRKAF